MSNVSKYRVLIVDDERAMCAAAHREILSIDGAENIYVDEAYTARVAVDKIRKSLFDLILLDLYKERVLAGYEVFRKLNELGCSVDIVIMTRFDLDPSVKVLFEAISAQGSARLVGFIDKREQAETSIRAVVQKHYDIYASSDLNISNLELASKIISRRRSRYERPKVFPLRVETSEIDAEVERLLRQLYVEIPRSSGRISKVAVALEAIERRGLSAAVVVNATVKIGFDGATEVHDGHKTVLKIGPKPDILEEASRFREFVRYGVELDQRVELLGVAARDSLGALVYSFAGGLYRKKLASLDDVLISDFMSGKLEFSRVVLRNLFSSTHWYSIRTGEIGVTKYLFDNYRTRIMLSSEQAEAALTGLPDEFGHRLRLERVPANRGNDPYFELSVGNNPALIIPDSSVLGLGVVYGSVPACLVHGDMHAGNVMLEMSATERSDGQSNASDTDRIDRVCLIDFRNAGPGPRTIDAVALEFSVRIADSEAVCRNVSEVGELGLSESARFDAAVEMAGREKNELALYHAVFDENGKVPQAGWEGAAAEILTGLRACFPDVSLAEYLSMTLRYTFRQLGFTMHPVARVRLLTWLSAQYSLLRELDQRR